MTDIIMPTHNHPELTIACLQSLAKHTDDFRVVWVDNGSTPDSINAVEKAMKEYEINYHPIRLAENTGFIVATNRGIRWSLSNNDTPEIILMNNDIQVTEGWLVKLIYHSFTRPFEGVIGVVTDTGKIQCFEKFKKMVGFNSGDPAEYFNSLPTMEQKIVASCVPFSCVLIKRRVFDRIGLLDESFSPYLCDDDDFCDRARLAKWDTVILLNVFVYHKHRATIFDLPDYEKIHERNKKLLERRMADRRADGNE